MLNVDSLSLAIPDYNWETIEFWYKDTVESEGFVLDEITVVFCSDEELLKMNIEHLNHDFYTDIITFDYTDSTNVSGDLFVSLDRVRENAQDLSLTFDEELNRVLIHGVLHLCGYGDKSDDEEKLMRQKEDFYLNKLKGFT